MGRPSMSTTQQNTPGTSPRGPKVETVGILSMCGKNIPLKDCLVVWKSKTGTDCNAWYGPCLPQILVVNVTMGAC